MDIKSLVSLMQTVTGGIILAIVLWAIIKGYLVPGWAYTNMKAERDDANSRLMHHLDPTYPGPVPGPHPG